MSAVLDSLGVHKEAVLARWLDLTLAGYGPATAAVWKATADPFANPVRAMLESGMRGLLDALADGVSPTRADRFAPHLDAIIRVRAVQDLSPSQAVGCLFLLKKVLRETLWPEIVSEKRFAELLALESAVDLLAQGAFEVYCQCREQVAGLAIAQVKRRYDRLLGRCGLLADEADPVDDPPTPAS